MPVLKIATRESPLALWQAEHVQALLLQAHPDLAVELLPMTTLGDQRLEGSLSKVGGKGLFVKELEQALLDGRADLAVHSMKDVPAEQPDGLMLTCFLPGEDPRDAFVSSRYPRLDRLPQGACVGTSSLRRQTQLKHLRPDLRIEVLRGNVGTRLEKLARGEAEATFLALAGLKRLDLEGHATAIMATDEMLPAVGQGALCVQARADDKEALAIAAQFNCPGTAACVAVERAFLAGLDGSCRTPIAGLARIEQGEIRFRGELLSPDGGVRYTAEKKIPYTDNCEAAAKAAGAAAAAELRGQAGESFFRSLGA